MRWREEVDSGRVRFAPRLSPVPGASRARFFFVSGVHRTGRSLYRAFSVPGVLCTGRALTPGIATFAVTLPGVGHTRYERAGGEAARPLSTSTSSLLSLLSPYSPPRV